MKNTSTDLVRLTMDLSRLLRRTMEKGVGEVNVLRLHALAIVADRVRIPMTDFAKAMNISRSSATEFADRMADCGYIRRVTDPKNRRAVLLTLTPEGQRIIKEGVRRKERMLQKLFAVLTAEDKAHMERILRRVLELQAS